jgi:hypothetical protein
MREIGILKIRIMNFMAIAQMNELTNPENIVLILFKTHKINFKVRVPLKKLKVFINFNSLRYPFRA